MFLTRRVPFPDFPIKSSPIFPEEETKSRIWGFHKINREYITYTMSDDCELWGCYDPGTWLSLTPEELAEGIKNAYSVEWIVGFDEKGEVAHIYEPMMP